MKMFFKPTDHEVIMDYSASGTLVLLSHCLDLQSYPRQGTICKYAGAHSLQALTSVR